MKRVLDVAIASVALGISAPLLGALALAVKVESAGPAFFMQTRIGRGGRPFRLVKLRTMRQSAESGPQITAAGDRRVTRVGALLRKAKLDEIPQLWNVLRGDMSLVGPRPEVPKYVERYRPEWRKLLDVRPGITDRASLTFRDEEAVLARATDRERAYVEILMPMKLQIALESLERASVLEDVAVLARTALAVMRRESASTNPTVAEAIRRIEQLETGARS